jgi:hypothetical protein
VKIAFWILPVTRFKAARFLLLANFLVTVDFKAIYISRIFPRKIWHLHRLDLERLWAGCGRRSLVCYGTLTMSLVRAGSGRECTLSSLVYVKPVHPPPQSRPSSSSPATSRPLLPSACCTYFPTVVFSLDHLPASRVSRDNSPPPQVGSLNPLALAP